MSVVTAQAWNMTFSFYHSLRTLPRELDEATALYRLPHWQRFTRLELPAAMIGLVWNAMMSSGGGWFFVAASEAISVLNRTYTLPGLGSYVATAVARHNLGALGPALLTMAVVIVLIDQLFWRPVVAWADRFRLEQSAATTTPRSWLLSLLRTARLLRLLGRVLAPLSDAVDGVLSRLTPVRSRRDAAPGGRRWSDLLYNGALVALTCVLFAYGLGEVGHVALLDVATLARVLVLLVVSTLVWTPVGVARAFVVRPQVLFMDEPFSALDVLTAENLRNEIDDLWRAGMFPGRSILLVTHNIEEAATLADRVIILGANPGHVRGEVRIDLPRPRDRHAPRFTALVEHMYAAMTHSEIAVGTPPTGFTGALAGIMTPQPRFPALPHVRAGSISGLLEVLVDRGGSADIADLTRALRVDVDDLLPILDAATLLGFAQTGDGAMTVTESGQAFADADVLRSKDLFRQQVLAHAPLVETIYHTLQEKRDGSMRDTFFLDILDAYYPDAEAERQFATAVDWGRYAALFEFDADDGRLRRS